VLHVPYEIIHHIFIDLVVVMMMMMMMQNDLGLEVKTELKVAASLLQCGTFSMHNNGSSGARKLFVWV
jgi:hypothetical protein